MARKEPGRHGFGERSKEETIAILCLGPRHFNNFANVQENYLPWLQVIINVVTNPSIQIMSFVFLIILGVLEKEATKS